MLEHLYAALRSPLGVVITVTEGTPEQVRQRLYRLKTDTADPDLAHLSFVMSPTDPNQIWIINGPAKRAVPSQDDRG